MSRPASEVVACLKLESGVIASWLLRPAAEAPCSVGAWDKLWSGRLRLDGDAGGTAAAALWWLSDMSVATSDLEGGKVVKGMGQGPNPVKGPSALVFSMVTGKSTYRAVCDSPSHIVVTG